MEVEGNAAFWVDNGGKGNVDDFRASLSVSVWCVSVGRKML